MLKYEFKQKYELIEDDSIVIKDEVCGNEHTLYRIRLLTHIGHGLDVGQLCGYIGSYDVLSQEDSCMLCPESIAYGRTKITGNGLITKSTVFGSQLHDCRVLRSELTGGRHINSSFNNSKVKWMVTEDCAIVNVSMSSLSKVVSTVLTPPGRYESDEIHEIHTDVISINVSDEMYNISIYNDVVRIGCQCHAYDKWLELLRDEPDHIEELLGFSDDMDEDDDELYESIVNRYKSIINACLPNINEYKKEHPRELPCEEETSTSDNLTGQEEETSNEDAVEAA